MAYKILSLDGGGVRGVISARVLDRLVETVPTLVDEVQLFAGTSTGAILAVALAQGHPPADLVKLYQDRSAFIFHDDILQECGDLHGLAGARYNTQNRKLAIQDVIGDVTLDSLLPKNVLVASYELDSLNPIAFNASAPRRWKAKFFHNYPGPGSDGGQAALDVIMRSSAAPTFFPIYQGFVDGGVVANNPSLCAVAQALNCDTGNQNLEDISLLSLGAGLRPQFLTTTNSSWGLSQWGLTLVDLMLGAGEDLADYQCRQFLGSRYLRVQPILPVNYGLDAVGQIEDMIAVADSVDIAPIIHWLNVNWQAA